MPPNAVARATYRARMVGEFYLSLRLPLAGTEGLQHTDQRGVSGLPQRPAHRLAQGRSADTASRPRHRAQDGVRRVPQLRRSRARVPRASTLRRCPAASAATTATPPRTAARRATPRRPHPPRTRRRTGTIVHAKKAADPECDSCHKWTEDWCVDCHARRPRSHTARLARHARGAGREAPQLRGVSRRRILRQLPRRGSPAELRSDPRDGQVGESSVDDRAG